MAGLYDDREAKMPLTAAQPQERYAEEDETMKAKKMASDSGLIDRLRTAIREIKIGRTVPLSKLSKSVSQRRKEIAHKARA